MHPVDIELFNELCSLVHFMRLAEKYASICSAISASSVQQAQASQIFNAACAK
jgi:hypothetical protein